MWHRYSLVVAIGVVAACLLFGNAPSAVAGMATYYFPHVADGRSGSTYYTSEFVFNNVQSTATVVTLSFYADSGAGWPLELRSLDRSEFIGSKPSFTFTLQAYETLNIYTGAMGTLATGWAVVQTTQPLNVTSAFTLFQGGSPAKLLWQAGVLPSPPATQISFAANVSPNRDVFEGVGADTGYAIGNPSASDAVITVSLLQRWGGAPVGVRTVNVPRGGHKAAFLSELFHGIYWGDTFHGTVRFDSNVGVAIMSLKRAYGGGNDLYSSVAVQPDIELRHNIVYDTEQNTSFELAQRISSPAEVVGTVVYPDDTSDADFFAIDLLPWQTIHVYLLAETVGSPLDAVVTLYDPNRNQVAHEDDTLTKGTDAVLTYTVPLLGTYYIRCASVNGTSSRGANYRMHVLVKQ